MATPSTSSKGRILRFGIFEADLAARELRKNGLRVRLQEQPFQLLALLIERPEDIVTREELRNKLWAADTFVDFDHSLNTAIKKIREALGDSAVNPRYIETIARRGYRFLASVEIQTQAVTEPALQVPSNPIVIHSELEVPIPRRALTRALFVLIQIMYLAFYLSALFHWQSIEGAVDPFLRGAPSQAVFILVVITAGLGIPLRFYLLSAAAFDYRRLGRKVLADIPADFRARSALGAFALLDYSENWIWRGICCYSSATICAFRGENVVADGVSETEFIRLAGEVDGTTLTEVAYLRLTLKQYVCARSPPARSVIQIAGETL